MKYHLCVEIEGEINRIHRGEGTVLFDENGNKATPSQAFSELVKAQKEGKKYYTGCDNMDKEGRCAGHESNHPKN